MFRITPKLTIDASMRHSQQHSQMLAKYQRELSTGLRLHRPSDDPAAMERALLLKFEDARFESDLRAINHVQSAMNQSVAHLLEAKSILTRAKEIAIDATQPDAEGVREIHALELDALLERLVALANSDEAGRFLFGGSRSDTPPFVAGPDGRIEYTGGDSRTEVPIGRHRMFELLYPGTEIFGSTQREPTIITGLTGAQPAGGTDSGVGRATLIVRHTNTSYAGGSGIAAGTGSATGDTVIGSAGVHNLTINDTSGDGSFGTISLNGGPSVDYTNTDTNLQIQDPFGRVVFVDTTSITSGFSGNVTITADGALSVDGGVTETAIDFSAGQILTDLESGRVTGIDSRNITAAGHDEIEYPGTLNVFNAIISLRDDLRSADNLTQRDINEIASSRAKELQRHSDRILQIVGEQSASLETLESLRERTEDLQLQTRAALGQLEGADLAEAAIGLQNEQQLLEMTYASLARVMDTSLFDFL